MHKLIVSLLLSASFSVAVAAGPMTRTERQRLIAHLEMTARWLNDEMTGLSSTQLAFRPAPGAWTILEVMDHLLVVAPLYWQDLQASLAGPGGQTSPARDADILWYGIDRTNRETAIASEIPKGLRDVRGGLAEYRKLHTRLLEYIKTTDDDLRGHLVKRQGCDAYQWALLISTHEQRHILQIREIKGNPKFPRN